MTKPATAKAKPASGGSDKTIMVIVLGAFGLAATSRGLDRATVWWETEGSAAWAAWLDVWRPRLTLGAVVLVAAVVALVVWRVRHWKRTRPVKKARTRAELRQPARGDGTIPPVKPVLNDAGETTALIVTLGLGEVPSEPEMKRWATAHGLDEWKQPAEYKMEINKGKHPCTQVILTKPAPDTRDRTERRLEEIATSALPDVISAKVTGRDGKGQPTAVRFEHKASFRALTNDVACENLERALVAALGWDEHTYRMTWDQQNDVAVLERWTDPLATVTPALPVDMFTKVDFAAIPLGVSEDGEPCTLNLTGGRHTLLLGATGSGKSSILHGAFRGAAPAIHAGLLQLRGLCPKGGAELGAARPLFYDLAAGPVNSKGPAAQFQIEDGGNLLTVEHARQLDLLTRAGVDCLMRAYRLGAQGIRQHVPTVEEPAVWVVIDEAALVTAYLGSKTDREQAVMAMAALLTQGRAWNFHLLAALQDPRMRTLEIRNLFTVKIGMRLDSKAEVAMTLGDKAIADGVRCDRISKDTPGVFYMLEDGGATTRNRAAYVTDADIRDVNERFAAPSWTPPKPMGTIDLREAVAEMVDPADLAKVEGALDELASVVKPAPKKRAPRKRAAAKPEAGPLASEPVMADAVAVGDVLSLTDEGGKRFEGTVALVEGDDPIRLVGAGWEREVESTETLRRLIYA